MSDVIQNETRKLCNSTTLDGDDKWKLMCETLLASKI